MCPYLLDESNDFKILRSEPGFNIPVLKEDFSNLMDLLNKANEEKKLGFFIDVSHKSPYSENHLIKTQFKNIPPNIDKSAAKKMFHKFGEIKDIYHKDGIWTVMYEEINWCLPYAFHIHSTTGSKNRWFPLHQALCSFSSKIPCSKCKIKGHHESSCPGASLIKLLEETNSKEDKQKQPIQPNKKPQTKESSDSDVDESSSSDSEDTKKPQIIPQTKGKVKNTKGFPVKATSTRGRGRTKKK